jgi:hypothetical protein
MPNMSAYTAFPTCANGLQQLQRSAGSSSKVQVYTHHTAAILPLDFFDLLVIFHPYWDITLAGEGLQI